MFKQDGKGPTSKSVLSLGRRRASYTRMAGISAGEWERNGKLTPNDPGIVEALQWMQGYAKKYDAGKLASFSDALRQAGANPFMSGKVGFAIEGNWLLNDIDSVRV